MPPKYDLPLYQRLQEEGLKVSGLNDAGQPIVVDEAGKEYDFPVHEMLAREKINPAEVNIEYNSPDEPVNVSPVGVKERAALSLGNPKGSLKYLKSKFEDSQYHPEQGLLVRKGGVWHKVDPTLLGSGSAWDKTKELVKDVVDLGNIFVDTAITTPVTAAGAAVGTAAGTVGGAVAGGFPGAVAGATYGGYAGGVAGAGAGGMAAAKVRTYLGRAVGTYDATPEEQERDIGLEALFTAGAQAVAPGMKPALTGLTKALGNIGKWGTDRTKDIFAGLTSGLAKVDKGAIRTAFEESTNVGKTMARAAAKLGPAADSEQVQGYLKGQKIEIMERILGSANKELPKKYGEFIEAISKRSEAAKIKLDISSYSQNTLSSLEKNGIGYFRPSKGGPVFEFWTPKQIGIRNSQGMAAKQVTPEAKAAINDLIQMLQGFGRAGKLEGEGAAKTIIEFEKTLNNMIEPIFSGKDQSLKHVVGSVVSSWRTQVKGAFDAAGLKKEYLAGQQLYAKYGRAVRRSRALLNSDSQAGIEVLANQFAGAANKNLKAKDMVGDMVELLGERGQTMYRNFMVHHSAEQFAKATPHLGWFQGTAAASGLTATVAGATSLPTTLAVGGVLAAQSTPKVAFRQLQAAQKVGKWGAHGVDWLKQLPPDRMKRFLSDDQAVEAFARIIGQGQAQEDELKASLIQGATSGK